jgi:hypothetical protein
MPERIVTVLRRTGRIALTPGGIPIVSLAAPVDRSAMVPPSTPASLQHTSFTTLFRMDVCRVQPQNEETRIAGLLIPIAIRSMGYARRPIGAPGMKLEKSAFPIRIPEVHGLRD